MKKKKTAGKSGLQNKCQRWRSQYLPMYRAPIMQPKLTVSDNQRRHVSSQNSLKNLKFNPIWVSRTVIFSHNIGAPCTFWPEYRSSLHLLGAPYIGQPHVGAPNHHHSYSHVIPLLSCTILTFLQLFPMSPCSIPPTFLLFLIIYALPLLTCQVYSSDVSTFSRYC